MIYWDSYGHLVPLGEEERYFKNNNMNPTSRFQYQEDKARKEQEKALSDILEESRKPINLIPSFDASNLLSKPKPSISGTLLDADNLVDIFKKSRLK